jgi:hypothetical protein
MRLNLVLISVHPSFGGGAKDPKSAFENGDGEGDLLVGRAVRIGVPGLNELPDVVDACLTTGGAAGRSAGSVGIAADSIGRGASGLAGCTWARADAF